MNYYDKIRDDFLEPSGLINKELSFGVELKFGYSYNPDDESPVERNQTARLAENRGRWLALDDGRQVEGDYEILGQPYDLREVMRWFNIKSKGYTFDCDDGILGKCTDMCGQYDIYIDLSKTLREQDLEPLYNLMLSLK